MISFLKGTIEYKSNDYIVLNVGNVGYKVFVPEKFWEKAQDGEELSVYVHYHQREDNVSLFGFESLDELDFFEKLLSVKGVGPKSALKFFIYEIKEMVLAILNKNIEKFTSISGVGKKTAEMVVLQLKNKFKNFNAGNESDSDYFENCDLKQQVADALISLGYSQKEAVFAVEQISEIKDVSEAVKECLRKMN